MLQWWHKEVPPRPNGCPWSLLQALWKRKSQGTMLTYQLLVALVCFFTIPLFGALSDRIGRRAMITAGIITMALFSFSYFWLVDTGSGPVIMLAMVLALSVFQAAAYAPQSAFIPELFDTRVRYSGAALGYNLAPETPMLRERADRPDERGVAANPREEPAG